MSNLISMCRICRDEGAEGGCTRCGKLPRVLEITNEFESNLEKIAIPSTYSKDLVWDSNKLMKSHPEKIGDDKFSEYVNIMNLIYKQATLGNLAKKSIMFIADPRCGKHTFIYSMMAMLQSKGYSVCPMIEHTDYLRISRCEVETPWIKNPITMNEIVYSDFCAMSVDGLNKYSATKAIHSLLTKRSYAQKPTFIISDFALSDLENKFHGDFKIRYSDGLDELRYCRIVRAF